MELSDRDFTRTLLLLFTSCFGRQYFVFIEAEQANVIAVLVIEETLDLILELFGLACGEDLNRQAVRQRHFLLERVQPAIDDDKSELAVEEVGAEVSFATATGRRRRFALLVELLLHLLLLDALPAQFRLVHLTDEVAIALLVDATGACI